MKTPVSVPARDDSASAQELPGTASLTCPICERASGRCFDVDGFWIRQCHGCGHQFMELNDAATHVERVYGDGYFTGGGAGYRDYLSEERLLIGRGRWYASKLARHCRPGVVLDVGAAAGFTLVGLRDAGWTTFGVEPNESMAQHARRRFQLDVEHASFESWQTEKTFDLVTMLQVIPHFPNPRQAIRKAAALVRPGGHLLVETYDRRSWTARLAGQSWHEYSPPSVLHWFSRQSLNELARQSSFEPLAGGRPSKWIDAGHAKSLLRHKAEKSWTSRAALMVARLVPDRLAIPYPADDVFWTLFRHIEVL